MADPKKPRLPRELQDVASSDDLNELKARVEFLEKRVKDKSAIIATLKETLEEDRNIDVVFTKFIDEHIDLKTTIKKAVDNFDREWFKSFIKKGGLAIGAIALALISGLAGYFLPHP